MLIGAQLFSVRDKCQTKEDVRATFKKMKELGYPSVQVSGFAYDPAATRAAADEFGLTIGLTHNNLADIINKTDEVINLHKILKVDVVGIGYPVGYCDGKTVEAKRLVNDLVEPVKKLNDAGMKLAYHNHYMEFADFGGYNAMDVFYDLTNWNFTLDCGWVDYAGADVEAYIKKYADRLEYVHLKDFTAPDKDGKRTITPIYTGATPQDLILKTLNEIGTVKVAYVEQDNAPDSGDSWGQMAISSNNLKAKGWM